MSADRDAVARILRDAGVPEPDVIALEILTALKGHGWRPTNVIHLPPPQPPIEEERMHAIAARARQALEEGKP